jgi:hypothetical protein
MLTMAGETETEFKAGVTVSVALPLMDPEAAVIVAAPVATPVATPPLTVATAVLEDVQVALPVRFCVLPSVYRPVAVKSWLPPISTLAELGVMLIELTAGGNTVNAAVPLMVPELAVKVTEPCATAVATPLLTVATVVLEEVHVALLVRFWVLPSL